MDVYMNNRIVKQDEKKQKQCYIGKQDRQGVQTLHNKMLMSNFSCSFHSYCGEETSSLLPLLLCTIHHCSGFRAEERSMHLTDYRIFTRTLLLVDVVTVLLLSEQLMKITLCLLCMQKMEDALSHYPQTSYLILSLLCVEIRTF